MFGLTHVSVDFLTHWPLLVSLALILLLGLAAYLYYRTNPPLPLPIRIVLVTLRIIAILALVAALLEPVISYSREFSRPRRIALLLDRSASMERVESGKSRQARLDSLLSDAEFAHLSQSISIEPWYFGDNLVASAGDVKRDRTALGDALDQLKSRSMSSPADLWLLLSDGRSNSGHAPSEAATGISVPVMAVNIASDLGSFDVALENIDYNPVLFAGQQTEIKVKINWRNAAGRTLKAQLLKGERSLSEATVNVSEAAGKGEMTLKYTPAEPGQELLQVSLPPAEGEETNANNVRTLAVKVLKSRLSVLLVAQRPDHEVGFLRRTLVQSNKYDVDLKVTGPRAGNLAGRFPANQTELNRYDLVVLYDPDPREYESKLALLKSYLSEKGGAVWVLYGEQFAARGPVEPFNKLLPFYQLSPTRIEYAEFHGEPSEANLFHPAVRIADDRSAIRDAWGKLPPFQSLVRCTAIDPQAVLLATLADPNPNSPRVPILGFKRFGPGKLFASAALPFWTWGFADIGASGSGANYTKFLDGVSRWLTTKDDFDPVRIMPEKEIFTRGEPVRFDGLAYDQGYRPITGVTGMVRLTHADGESPIEADLVEQGEGKYQATFDQVTPGTYRYVATMSKDGSELKRNEGNIVVEKFSLEEFDQSGDPATLMAVARLSGGSFYSYRQFASALTAIDRKPINETVKGELVLWNKIWLLLIFIGALSLEWGLRKFNQLI